MSNENFIVKHWQILTTIITIVVTGTFSVALVVSEIELASNIGLENSASLAAHSKSHADLFKRMSEEDLAHQKEHSDLMLTWRQDKIDGSAELRQLQQNYERIETLVQVLKDQLNEMKSDGKVRSAETRRRIRQLEGVIANRGPDRDRPPF